MLYFVVIVPSSLSIHYAWHDTHATQSHRNRPGTKLTIFVQLNYPHTRYVGLCPTSPLAAQGFASMSCVASFSCWCSLFLTSSLYSLTLLGCRIRSLSLLVYSFMLSSSTFNIYHSCCWAIHNLSGKPFILSATLRCASFSDWFLASDDDSFALQMWVCWQLTSYVLRSGVRRNSRPTSKKC